MANKLVITQVGSEISRPESQGKTLKALGLGKIGRTVEQPDNPAIRGMIFKVTYSGDDTFNNATSPNYLLKKVVLLLIIRLNLR